FPFDCGPVQQVVKKQASGDLDGDGRPETVAVVHCDAPMGTPPDGVYVLTRSADDATPRVVATPAPRGAPPTAAAAAGRGGDVNATLLGDSSADVPSCCPDVRESVKWRWDDGSFTRSTPSGARSV